ncbi:hypothetical protein [Azospirillum sp.]|uniref:hypothetical protein n=1 Tax=Azospirillum sp. TaxID=34012 RepID=UPI002D52F209|nr:hypothetical protein [Azospirillum sp.]HYD66405.1 hypothetical protein [Azospirillum sp.]
MAKASQTPCDERPSPSLAPPLAQTVGVLLLAGALFAAVLLLVDGPFAGPWRVVLAVAVGFAAVYAGCLTVGCCTGDRRPGAQARRG